MDDVIAGIRAEIAGLKDSVGELRIGVAKHDERLEALATDHARFHAELPNFHKMEITVGENNVLLGEIKRLLMGDPNSPGVLRELSDLKKVNAFPSSRGEVLEDQAITKAGIWNASKGAGKVLAWAAGLVAAIVTGAQFLMSINHPPK